ncbi:Cytochrome c bioproteinsis protein family isoform 1 [Hibiscus syriacus]|uniref:Protein DETOXIFICATION n=1 Tax=Hibiscus syriacus TaxID=106335 RepID=A0A6A2XZG1_HIBSY|nr:Cytochrome c bioproteinsis protein family isoform 1 [Hibiscus syriacus]
MDSTEAEEKPTEVKTFRMERQSGGEPAVKQKIIRKSWEESKKMWEIAGPAILVSVSQFSIGFVTVAFAGHLGELQLAAVTITTNVIEGFVFGMGSALETLCGQAVGAGQHNMLGIYLQRSWIIAGITALSLTPCYLLAAPILNLLRQDKDIAELAGKYCRMVIPQFFAYAINFPIQRFLQAQTKVWVMTVISVVSLGCHVLLNWALVTKLELGLLGAAMAGNISWWLQVIAMVIYVVSGVFPDSWTGLSLLAFKSLWGFVKLSLASALGDMVFSAIILMVGYLKNPTLAVDSISICMNFQLWTSMVTLGFNVAASVRVANELGPGRPKAAKFSIMVTALTSLAVGIAFTAVLLATKHDFPKLFSDKPPVIKAASNLGYFLAATIFLNSILPVLHGVAVGEGWQAYVGLINIVCYYIFGIPAGALLGFKFNLRVQGIWSGMLVGTVLQTTILLFLMLRATWRKEVRCPTATIMSFK